MADPNLTHPEIREAVRRLCARFDGAYWRGLDRERAYPTAFVQALTEAGFLGVLIPETYGGSGLGLGAAAAVLEEIHRSGGNGAACHAQMYVMGVVLRHGSDEQKRRYLPDVASGALRLQAFAVTEPDAGVDSTRIDTRARREGDRYIVNGRKIWISRTEHSDLMVLLCRTSPRSEAKPTEGLTVLLVDMRQAVGNGLTIRPVRTMLNHATTELFFDNLEVPAENLIGEEGQGFRYILDGMNAERILIASECIGDGRFFIDRASAYARERQVFGRPIGQNQGVQFPIARNYVQLSAAALMVDQAARMFDAGEPCGTEANMAKMLASEASWAAADTCLQTHGGLGFAEEFDHERKFRATRHYQVAPISPHQIHSHVGTHVLGMPKSFRPPPRELRSALSRPRGGSAPASSPPPSWAVSRAWRGRGSRARRRASPSPTCAAVRARRPARSARPRGPGRDPPSGARPWRRHRSG
jgi:alkylation response protein AidB-like acyl-CoA dehydrogenase